ncbi:hypothetical protein LTR08_005287 [Meristemomyces frigidus]|nr:hypothetical protein LTR08_005287 [Meristemomyces frigidus]
MQPLALLLLPLAALAATPIYPKSSHVLQLDPRTYHSLIEASNHTSIVEFYAPWCGHCQNLAPAYEKAAKSLAGLAKVAAVNCDEESNKQFCGGMGVKGFPTLKIVRPARKAGGKPVVEEYQGARSAKGIVDAVVGMIPNHVTRLKDGDYEAWLDGAQPKAILFSDKSTTGALLKAVAVDFLGVLDIAQVRKTETQAVEVFAVTKFPALVLLPGAGKDPVHYSGEMKKEAIVAFLSQAASPNPDPAPKKAKPKAKTTANSKPAQSSAAFSKSSSSQASKSASKRAGNPSQTAQVLDDAPVPSDATTPDPADPNIASPDPDTNTPVNLPPQPHHQPLLAPPIPSLQDGLSLQQTCLNSKAGTCILALLPHSPGLNTIRAISALSEIAHKHSVAKRVLFPFYQLPAGNSQAGALRRKLALASPGAEDDVEILAINGKKAWYRHFPAEALSQPALEAWIDSIRLSDPDPSSPKLPMPGGLIADTAALPAQPVKVEMPQAAAAAAAGSERGDQETMEELKRSMRGQLPEGVEFELEEVGDEEYERLMARGKGEGGGHDEL